MKIRSLASAVSAVALSIAIPAAADAAVFNFTYAGTAGSGISGSGTITTGQANPPGSFFTPSLLITGITGTFNGEAITSLLAPGTFYKTTGIFGSPGNDNILYYPSTQTYMNQPTSLDRYGLGLATANDRYNLFFGLGGYGVIVGPTGSTSVTSDVGGTFTISPAATGAVPEPASWAMMLTGFGAMGGALRVARRTARLAIA